MTLNTKSKIIATATHIFNNKGFGATNMQDIAGSLYMSRGNLRYHFRDRDALLEAIIDELWAKMNAERSKSRALPTFANLHSEVQLYYKFQKEYSFVFLDTQVLNHPIVQARFRQLTEQTIQDNRTTLAFALESGNLQPERIPGTYNSIAFITWMLTFYWLSQQIIRGEIADKDGEKVIWSILIPHFTEKGLTAFKHYFGEEYTNSLGEAFHFEGEKPIMF